MSNQNQQPEIEELERMGKEGKLWAIEILYECDGEVCRMTYRNQTNPQIMKIRSAIFQVGIVVAMKDSKGMPIAGSYRCIPPQKLLDVFLHRQSGYFH